MTSASPERVEIVVDATQQVSGLLQVPGDARACCVLAHGAGAGMAHPFMAAVANGLAERGIATLRYQFPYMERGSKRPDPPKLAHATVRAAVDAAAQRLPGMPLVAGGKSFGGRMTSQAQAASPLPGVQGLVFLGFPLHPAGRPSDAAAAARAGARRACDVQGHRTRRPFVPRARALGPQRQAGDGGIARRGGRLGRDSLASVSLRDDRPGPTTISARQHVRENIEFKVVLAEALKQPPFHQCGRVVRSAWC